MGTSSVKSSSAPRARVGDAGRPCDTWRRLAGLGAMLLLLAGVAGAQEAAPGSAAAPDDAAAQANNPLANFTAFNIHDYYIGELTESGGEPGNQFWLRYAKPFSIGKANWLMRASLPINTYPVGPALDRKTGLGDTNVFAAYLINTGNPGISLGVGPQVTIPTASRDELGSEKWSVGVVNTLFNSKSKKVQYGYLVSWQTSIAGQSDRAEVNAGAFQPFLFYQLGGGLHLRSSAVMAFNLANGDYSLPLGLGVGKVIARKKVIQNFFVEPQFKVADEGPGWPKWQIFVGFNSQF